MMSQTTLTGQEATPAPRGVRNSATRIVASTLGVYGGLLGLEHGYFETLQGGVAPNGIMMSAIGPPCQASTAWHGCEPAMTIIPNFFVTGVLAVIVSLIVVIGAAAFVQRKYGGLALILLSLIQLLVGGGFIPIPVIIIAGVVGTRIHAPLTWWRAHLSARSRRFLAALWPWSLIAYFILNLGQFMLGSFFNEFMLHLSVILGVVLPLGLVLLTVLTAFAYDIQRQSDSHQVPAMSG
jgi:hypothetical protein